MSFVVDFIRNECGATAIEYGLLAALVGVVIIGGVTSLGNNLKNTFSKTASAITTSN